MDILIFFASTLLVLIGLYLLGRIVNSAMQFLHLNSYASRKFSDFIRNLGIMLPLLIGVISISCLCTLNVPLNFIIIVILSILFSKYIFDYVAGLIFRITSKASINDSILVAGKGGEILSIDNISLSIQSPKGRIILPYAALFEKGYTVSKKPNVANRVDIIIDLEIVTSNFEEIKSDLTAILSNSGYIGRFSKPTFSTNQLNNQVLVQIYLDSMEDPMDLILLLREKKYVCH